jgi:hypothetical protein
MKKMELYYVKKMKLREIAEMEGVSAYYGTESGQADLPLQFRQQARIQKHWNPSRFSGSRMTVQRDRKVIRVSGKTPAMISIATALLLCSRSKMPQEEVISSQAESSQSSLYEPVNPSDSQMDVKSDSSELQQEDS